MSPRELYRELDAVKLRLRDEAEAQQQTAWMIANWTGMAMAGTLPDYAAATKPREPKRQSPKEFATMARLLSGRYGHTLIRRVS